MSIAEKITRAMADINEVYEAGQSKGYREGTDYGFNWGYQDGYSNGNNEGYENGYTTGRTEGYDTGYAEGETAGYDRGYAEGDLQGQIYGREQGEQAEWSEFWDGFQDYGKRGYYMGAFSRWPESIFWPKYDIRVTEGSPSCMFASTNVPNLKQRLKDCGVVLDFSRAVNITEALAYNPYFTNLPTVDTRNVSTFSHVFCNDTALVEIEKFILKADGSQTFGTGIFGNCPALEDITIEGVIGSNGFDVHWSTKLSKASITSIINALSTTTSGLTVTLSKTSVNNAFGGSTSAEWLALVATRPNWTIALA